MAEAKVEGSESEAKASVNVSFSVPGLVPSKANHRHSNKRASREAWSRILNYQMEVGMSALAAGVGKYRGKGKARVKVLLINQKVDLDNALKAPIDGLKRVAFVDDSPEFVEAVQVSWTEDDGLPRAEYRLEWF